MATLNRFPLLALWAREAALRIGYLEREADALGHAYAVLYAIRAHSPERPVRYKDAEAAEAAREVLTSTAPIESVFFGGDEIHVSRNTKGELVGRVGDYLPQTAESFRYKVKRKYPGDYFDRLQVAFRDFLSSMDPQKLNSRLVYTLYDQWKLACASGRDVNLDQLLDWCTKRKPA